MNYYDEILEQIEELLKDREYDKARRIIMNELDVAYVPRDFEKKLLEYLQLIRQETYVKQQLSDEMLEGYLFSDEQHQLIAVDELNRRNLRDHLQLCERYLSNDHFPDAAALLMDSLIYQQIDHEFKVLKDGHLFSFVPSRLCRPQDSEGFQSCLEALRKFFMKEPSKCLLAEKLLYKECLLALPEVYDRNKGLLAYQKIARYIDDAFDNC